MTSRDTTPRGRIAFVSLDGETHHNFALFEDGERIPSGDSKKERRGMHHIARIGPAAHRKTRGFASTIGMKRHIEGLIAFAHQVDPAYAHRLYTDFNRIDWTA